MLWIFLGLVVRLGIIITYGSLSWFPSGTITIESRWTATLQWCPAGEGVAGPFICLFIVVGTEDGHGMRDEGFGIFVSKSRTCNNEMFVACHRKKKVMFVTFGRVVMECLFHVT